MNKFSNFKIHRRIYSHCQRGSCQSESWTKKQWHTRLEV